MLPDVRPAGESANSKSASSPTPTLLRSAWPGSIVHETASSRSPLAVAVGWAESVTGIAEAKPDWNYFANAESRVLVRVVDLFRKQQHLAICGHAAGIAAASFVSRGESPPRSVRRRTGSWFGLREIAACACPLDDSKRVNRPVRSANVHAARGCRSGPETAFCPPVGRDHLRCGPRSETKTNRASSVHHEPPAVSPPACSRASTFLPT